MSSPRSPRARRRIKPSRMNFTPPIPKRKSQDNPTGFSVEDCSIKASDVTIVVKGKPRSWIRASPRLVGGKISVFNPNAQEQKLLHNALAAALREVDGNHQRPIFGPNIPVFVSINFLLPRPMSHFHHNRIRAAGNIKPQYRRTFSSVVPDLDNLLKFHLDTPFKDLLLHDDRQVTSVFVRKMYDVLGDCKGHTEIHMQEDTFISHYFI